MYSIIPHFHLQTFYKESISEIDTLLIHATCAETRAAEHKDALAHGYTSTAEHKNIPFKRGTQAYQDCSTHRCKGTAVLTMSQCKSTGVQQYNGACVCVDTAVHADILGHQCTVVCSYRNAHRWTGTPMHIDHTDAILQGCTWCCSTEVEVDVLLHTWYQHACVLMPQCAWMYFMMYYYRGGHGCFSTVEHMDDLVQLRIWIYSYCRTHRCNTSAASMNVAMSLYKWVYQYRSVHECSNTVIYMDVLAMQPTLMYQYNRPH